MVLAKVRMDELKPTISQVQLIKNGLVDGGDVG